IEQHIAHRLRWAPCGGVGDQTLDAEGEPREIGVEAVEPARRAVDGGDARAGGGELRRLAAGCGTEIDDALAGDVAEERRRHRRGGVLHPPGAGAVAGQAHDRAAAGAAQRAGRQQDGFKLVAPGLRVAPDGEVERRLLEVSERDAARALLAVGLAPAAPQPIWRIEPRRVLLRHEPGPFLAQTAKYGV